MVDVEVDEQGAPLAITEAGDRRTVVAINESWRVDDEWWRSPIGRRYVDVVVESGAHLILYQDLVNGEWFVQKP